MSLVLEDLLSRGYFPKELPPPFTTRDYGSKIGTSSATALTAAFTTNQPYKSALSKHVLLRSGTLSRQLGIPNPVHFYRLANHVVARWGDLEALATASPFSASKPRVSVDVNKRALEPSVSLSDTVSMRAECRRTARYLVKADVAKFYPSIYTHAIPWAVLTKTIAKAMFNANNLSSEWSSRLDRFARNANSQQTVGVPIGPDTSLLFAELILSRIDRRLKEKCKFLKGHRFIDDYELVTDSLSNAEKTLSVLKSLLSEYELELNGKKTKIITLPDELDSDWVSKLRVFNFRSRTVNNQKYDLIEYFNLVFDFHRSNPNENVIKYGVGRLHSVSILDDNFKLLEDLLAQCVLTEPACVRQVWSLLHRCRSAGSKSRKSLWGKTLNKVLVHQAPLNHSNVCAWTIWVMKELGIKIQATAQNSIANTNDCATGLMGLWMVEEGLADSARLKSLETRFSSAQNLFGPNWLLCYEANFQGWFGTGGRARIRTVPAFDVLDSKDVSFLNKTIATPAPTRPASSAVLTGAAFGGGSGDD